MVTPRSRQAALATRRSRVQHARGPAHGAGDVDGAAQSSGRTRRDAASVVDQLRALEDARRDGTIELPDGERLGVTNLAKLFWPSAEAHQRRSAPLLRDGLAVHPAGRRRPAAGDEALPERRRRAGVLPAALAPGEAARRASASRRSGDDIDPISEPDARRFIGGSLITLLYMTQIAAISQDPWFSRVQSPLDADYVAIDLDPGEGTPFARVLDVARWVHDELESLKVPAVPKTSGSRGLHIYIPLPPGTVLRVGHAVLPDRRDRRRLAASEGRDRRAHGAARAARDGLRRLPAEHPRQDAGDRLQRPRQRLRRRVDAADWKEVDEGIDPRDFTIITAPARFREVGDLWARLRTAKPANLEAVFRKYRLGGASSRQSGRRSSARESPPITRSQK